MLRPILSIWLSILSCVYVVNANASSFLLESEISAGVIYDDNVKFVETSTESSSIVTVHPEMRLKYQSDIWDTAVNADVLGVTYSAEFQDQIDAHLDVETAYKDNRNIYSISAGYDNVSDRISDENALDPIAEQNETRTLTLTPKYTRLLTERFSLSLAYSYSDVNYSPNTLGWYRPYEIQTTTGELAYKLSKRSELSLSLEVTDYASENNISEYQMLASKFGIVHNFSKMITAEMFVGVNSSDFTTKVTPALVVETNSSGAMLEAAVNAKWIELRASRRMLPNSTGGLDQTDQVSATLRMQVTPLIGVSLLLTRKEINELNDSLATDNSRTYTKIRPAMTFTLTRNLRLRAEYILLDQKYANVVQGSPEKAKFSMNLKYIFPSI